MKNIRYLALVMLFFLVIFAFIRGLLLWRYIDLAQGIDAGTMIKAFFVGLRFDLTVTGYLVAPVALIGLLPRIGFSSSRITRRISTIYLTIVSISAFFLNIVDLEFFGQFNTRLNHLALQWWDTPEMVLQMLWESFSLPLYLLFTLILVVGIYLVLRLISKVTFNREEKMKWYWQLAIYPLALGLLFLAIRGRISKWSPINWGVAYYSPYNFTNQLALNSCFTFVNDTLFEDADRTAGKEFESLMTPEAATERVRAILGIDKEKLVPNQPIARIEGDSVQKQMNVIIVVMESLAADFVSSCGGVEDLAPEIDRIARDGILFPNFFGNAGFTRNAVFSIVTGLPPMQGKPLINRMEGQYEFSGLGTLLKERGYRTRFYIPHDPHFDNMQGFTLANAFEKLTSKNDFPADSAISSLGVPDGVLYRRALSDFDQLEEPFLAVILTGSNHHPFICPDVPYPRYDPDSPNAVRFDAFLYADYAMGRFYDRIRESDWGENTLLVIFGDTGLNWHPTLELDLSLYRTPLLLICPGQLEPDVSNRMGSQIDVVATVMDILGGQWINNTLGESLLKPGDNHAIFHHSGALGFIRDNYYFLRTRDGDKHLFVYPSLQPVLDQPERIQQLYLDFAAFTITTHYIITSRLQGIPGLTLYH